MKNLLQRFRSEENAATAVEYAVIAALVGVSLIAVLRNFSGAIGNMINRAIQAINAA